MIYQLCELYIIMNSNTIIRRVYSKIQERLFRGKAMLILGQRQVGKSTLCDYVPNNTGQAFFHLNGDDADVRSELRETSATGLRAIIGSHKLVFIDKAQRIPNVGLTLKIFVDQFKDVQVIVTGSSAFDLANLSIEPLTGRKYEFFLFPLSFGELVDHHGLLEEKRRIEHHLIFGSYPEIITHQGKEEELLKLLSGSYLYKDLLMLEQIKKPVLLEKSLKALALQLGNEINYHELGQVVGADKNTVEKYLDLLEKTYVIFIAPAFNPKLRNELKKEKRSISTIVESEMQSWGISIHL